MTPVIIFLSATLSLILADVFRVARDSTCSVCCRRFAIFADDRCRRCRRRSRP